MPLRTPLTPGRLFYQNHRVGEWLAAKERLAYTINDIVEKHGAGFAFPSTSLYVETLPFGTPESFTPPESSQFSPMT